MDGEKKFKVKNFRDISLSSNFSYKSRKHLKFVSKIETFFKFFKKKKSKMSTTMKWKNLLFILSSFAKFLLHFDKPRSNKGHDIPNSWEFRLIHVKDKKKKAGKKKITSCSYVGIRAFLEKVLQSCNHGNHLAQSSVHYLQNTHTTFQVHLDPDKVNFTTEESFFFRPIPRAETGTAWREWVK